MNALTTANKFSFFSFFQFHRLIYQRIQTFLNYTLLIVSEKNIINSQNIYDLQQQNIIKKINMYHQENNNRNKEIEGNRQIETEYSLLQRKNNQKKKLCCRQFFQSFQQVQAESFETQYQNFPYPWDQQCKRIIMNSICAFLNTSGGNIYIGIVQKKRSSLRFVKGFIYDEHDKEQLQKDVTIICSKISPDIAANNLVKVEFIEVIKDGTESAKNTFVVKISVNQRYSTNSLYYVIDQGGKKTNYYFRTKNEVISRTKWQADKILSQRQRGLTVQKLYPHQFPCGRNHREKQTYNQQIRKQHLQGLKRDNLLVVNKDQPPIQQDKLKAEAMQQPQPIKQKSKQIEKRTFMMKLSKMKQRIIEQVINKVGQICNICS